MAEAARERRVRYAWLLDKAVRCRRNADWKDVVRRVRLPVLHPDAAVTPRTPFPATEVHVWRLDLTAHGTDSALWPLLDEGERARACRFRFAIDRQRFIVAHGQVRCVLGWYLDAPPARLRFAFGPH